MKLLIVGAESQIGSALVSLLTERAVPFEKISFTDASSAPIADLENRIRTQHITFIVNVDHIEGLRIEGLTQRELEQRHVFLPQQLAKIAEAIEIPLLQISDYQVFTGSSEKPYTEEDEPHSQTLYGVTRWQGELSVQRFTHRYIILRVGTIFCTQGYNLFTVLLEQWKQGHARELSSTLQFSPTPTNDIARVIYAILQQVECGAQVWGIYHYCSADIATPYDFAEVLLAARVQFVGVDNEIKIRAVQGVVTVKNKSRPAQPVPTNAVLVCQKILNTFGIRQRPWRGDLTRMVKEVSLNQKTQERKYD
jgi:dTDP-4-dehydrorhamnose reductase